MGNSILIIDDEPDLLSDIGTILEIKGFDVILANNGQMGIDSAIQHIPALILCDIMMPQTDGYEVLKAVSSHPDTSSIPFIFMSAKSTKEDIREGMNLGADDYISKPFDLEGLLEAVTTRIKKAETSQDVVNKKFDEIREVMSKTLPHEFRTPLNSILGYSDFLIKNWEQSDKESAVEMLTVINQDAKRLNRLFENYLSYTQVAAATEDPTQASKYRSQSTEIPEIIMKDIVMMSTYDTDFEVEYDLNESDFSVAMDKKHFTKLIHELADNAKKFSEESRVIRINSSLVDSKLQLSFSNKGREFGAKQLNDITAFSQLDRDKYEQQGTGMGLAIVKKIVELYNAEIDANTDDEGWTSITLKMPLAHTDNT